MDTVLCELPSHEESRDCRCRSSRCRYSASMWRAQVQSRVHVDFSGRREFPTFGIAWGGKHVWVTHCFCTTHHPRTPNLRQYHHQPARSTRFPFEDNQSWVHQDSDGKSDLKPGTPQNDVTRHRGLPRFLHDHNDSIWRRQLDGSPSTLADSTNQIFG